MKDLYQMTAEDLLQETVDALAEAERLALKSGKLFAKAAQLADATARAFHERGEQVMACRLGEAEGFIAEATGSAIMASSSGKRGHCAYLVEAAKMPDVPTPMPRGGGR